MTSLNWSSVPGIARREADRTWKLTFTRQAALSLPAHRTPAVGGPATLRRIHNAVSAVFAVEGADLNEASQTLDQVMVILSGEAVEQLEVFGQWMTYYLAGTPAETAVTERLRSARDGGKVARKVGARPPGP